MRACNIGSFWHSTENKMQQCRKVFASLSIQFDFSFFQEKSKSFKNSLFIDIYIYSCVLHVMVDAKICIYLIIYSKIMHIGTWWRNGDGAKTKMQHA